jgi:hypothetical protein
MQWEFELGVILLTILILVILKKSNEKIYKRFGLAVLAIFLFEYFTHPLWINSNLQPWAYLYLDVSWIITLCWADLILVSMAIGEYMMPKAKEWKQFLSTLALITVSGLYLEWLFLRLGIRQYPDVIKGYLASSIRIGNVVPIIELMYIPTFMALIIGFVRYWEISTNVPKKAIKKQSRGKKK